MQLGQRLIHNAGPRHAACARALSQHLHALPQGRSVVWLGGFKQLRQRGHEPRPLRMLHSNVARQQTLQKCGTLLFWYLRRF